MPKPIRIVLAVVAIIAVAGIGLLLPSAYHAERSIVIAADAPAIHVRRSSPATRCHK